MANTSADQISKVYDIRSLGAPEVINDLRNINKELLEIRKNKLLLSNAKGSIEDTKQLKAVDEALDQLNIREQSLITTMKDRGNQAVKNEAARRTEVESNSALAGSYDALKEKYTELLAIAKGAIPLTDPAQVKAAADELAILKTQIDSFDATLKQSTVAAKEQAAALSQMTTAQGEVSAAILAGREVEAQYLTEQQARTSGVVVTQEETAALREQQLAMAELNVTANERVRIQREGVVVEDVELTKIEQLAQTLLITEQELLAVNAAIKANNEAYASGAIAEQEYIAAGTRLTAEQTVLKANVASTRSELLANTKAVLAVGTSMKELGVRVGILREQYRNLTLAQRESAEGRAMLTTIQNMDGQIKRLDASIGNSQRNVGNYLQTLVGLDNIGRKLITSFVRMGIHFIAFALIMESVSKVIEYFTEKMKNSEQGITEHDKKLEESSKAIDRWNARKEKQIQLIQQENEEALKLPNVFGGLSDTGIRDLERQLELMKAQQESGKNALKDKAANLELDKQIFDLEQKITTQKLAAVRNQALQTQFALNKAYSQQEGSAILEGIKKVQIDLDEKKKDLENQLKVNEVRFKRLQEDKYNPYKAPPKVKDTTNEVIAADRFNIEQIAKLREADYRIDQEKQREVYENTKENLDKRLQAYQEYSNDLKLIVLTDKNAEIDATKDTLRKIEEFKKNQAGGGTITPAQKKLIDQELGYRAQLERLEKDKNAELAKIDADGAKARVSIVKSDVQERLAAINVIKEQSAAAANVELKALQDSFDRGEISLKKYKERERLILDQAHVHELKLIKEYLETQIAAYQAAGRDATELQTALGKVNTDLFNANRQVYDDMKKKAFDIQDFYKKLKETAIDSASAIADAWVAGQQRMIDKEDERARNTLDKQKEADLNNATSAEEKAAIEEEYDRKAQDLERAKFERQKDLAIAQLEIEFAIASIKAINAGFDTGGIYGAIAAEGLVALEYATKLAIIKNSQYALGGEVPSEGGEFGGRPHSDGGTPFMFKGRGFTAEAKELVILNKKTSQSNQRVSVSGTPKQIASALNVMGGGISFSSGASLRRFEYGGTLGSNLSAPVYVPSSTGGGDIGIVLDALNRSVTATNSRIDNLKVSLNPHDVRRFNRDHDNDIALSIL